MKKILYITSSLFPYGQAYSTRVIGFIKLFESLGIKVRVIADSTKEKGVQRGQIYGFSKSEYCITGKPGRINRMFLNRFYAADKLKKELASGEYGAVLMNADDDRFGLFRKICHKHKIPLYLEICEWFDITTYKLRKFDYRYYRMNRMRKSEYRKADGVIAISRLLAEHFTSLGAKTIRIPTLTDVSSIRCEDERDKKKFVLVHAGTAVVYKEKFKNIMLAILNLGENVQIEYRIYGSPYETVLANIGGDEELISKLGNRLSIMGTVPHDEVFRAYREADLSIFMRDNKLQSNAGFPTKLAESMASGTPVISNNTGDIGLYLKNGYNGYLTQNNSVEEIESAIRASLALTEEERAQMRNNARKTAMESFDFNVYRDLITEFIKGKE